MRDLDSIIQNAILYVAGNEGITRFNRAGYGSAARELVHPDGSLDLPRLMNIMLDVFPEEQASSIADNVLAKYVEMVDDEKKKKPVAAAPVESAPAPAESGMSYEDNLAQYLATEASDVQDLINEARMIRMAMGKAAPPKATNGGSPAPQAAPVPETPKVSIVNPVMQEAPRVSIVRQAPPAAPAMPEPQPPREIRAPAPEVSRTGFAVPAQAAEPPAPAMAPSQTPAKAARISIDSLTANTRPSIPLPASGELDRETLESEIARFVEERKAYSSVDIMDFIRYLKDKGYHFQENSVLESVYTWVEERKSRERAALLADIQAFLDRMPWPTESQVSAYIDQKKSEGIMCEAAEIKRMILVEMIRKH